MDTATALRSLFTASRLAELDAVATRLRADPTALDNKTRREVSAPESPVGT